ncbi:MAG: AAA family ATPase, partial [Actinomycetota bacterium]
MGVRVRLLGGFGVEVDGKAVDVSSMPLRARQLVKLLALSPRQRLLRDQVIESLFGHLDPEAGAANLHKAASVVRRQAADRRAVVLEQGTVALWPDVGVEVDADRFASAAEAAIASGDRETSRRIAASYGGELLPAERYEAWAEAPRARLRRLAIEVWRAAEEWARLAEVDPTDEAAHRELMRAHDAAGNRAGVLEQYRRVQAALRDELGTAPDDETVHVFKELTRGAAPQAPVLQPEVVIGREVELARVRVVWRQAAAGQGGGLLVRGEAGIGKTLLCELLLAEAAEAGWATLRGAGARAEGAVPYAPIVEAVDRVMMDRPDLAEGLPEAPRATLAHLAAAASGRRATPSEPLARQQVVSAVARLVAAAAKENGVVLFVDDLHAADDDTVALVHYLMRAAAFQRVLVVAAIRAGDERSTVTEARRDLLDSRRAAEIELGPLSHQEATALLAAAGALTLRPDEVERLYRSTGGNPFLLRELATTTGTGPVPDPVAATIAARLAALDTVLREALTRVAVAGEAVTTAEFVAASSLPEDRATAVLDAALDAGFLIAHDRGYRFRHGLVREAIVDALPPHRRAEAHRTVAAALEAAGAPAARIAHHLLAGERPAQALPYLGEAARGAAAVGAYRDARYLAEQALEISHGDADLLALRADMAFATGDPTAPAAYTDAVAAAAPDQIGPLLVRQARAHVAAADPAAAAAV